MITAVLVALATVAICATALLIIALGCIDDLMDENHALKRASGLRILELERENRR